MKNLIGYSKSAIQKKILLPQFFLSLNFLSVESIVVLICSKSRRWGPKCNQKQILMRYSKSVTQTPYFYEFYLNSHVKWIPPIRKVKFWFSSLNLDQISCNISDQRLKKFVIPNSRYNDHNQNRRASRYTLRWMKFHPQLQ